MSQISISVNLSTDQYGSDKLASVSLVVPAVGLDIASYAKATPAQIDAVEEQFATRLAEVRREVTSQIAAARLSAEKAAAEA